MVIVLNRSLERDGHLSRHSRHRIGNRDPRHVQGTSDLSVCDLRTKDTDFVAHISAILYREMIFGTNATVSPLCKKELVVTNVATGDSINVWITGDCVSFLATSSSAIVHVVTAKTSLTTTEIHRIIQVNNCGTGTPVISWGVTGSWSVAYAETPADFTASGEFKNVLAWLDTGCQYQGAGCGIVEFSLANDGTSTADISLWNQHSFSVATSFVFTGGCVGYGADCSSASCGADNAFFATDDYTAQRECTDSNVGLTITYC
ncbi:hypothetical protein RQP46_011033 [Phenoliferia psychrophenolica]